MSRSYCGYRRPRRRAWLAVEHRLVRSVGDGTGNAAMGWHLKWREGRLLALVSIGGNQIGDADALCFEGVHEVSPMNFSFGTGCRYTKCHAFSVAPSEANRDQYSAVSHCTVEANFDVGGVKKDVGDFRQWAIAPKLELGVEFGGQARDLAGCDLHTTKLFHDICNAACRNTLKIHFSYGYFESTIGATAFFKEAALEWF